MTILLVSDDEAMLVLLVPGAGLEPARSITSEGF